MRGQKQNARHRIIYDQPNDIQVVILAKLGRSTAYIMEETGLTECQISYRLHKAKVAQGYDKGHTYRSEWRNGTGAVAKQVERFMAGDLRWDVKNTLPKLFAAPVLVGAGE